MRAMVAHLTRNILITKEDKESWGCRILNSKYTDTIRDIVYEGQTVLKGVEIKGCG
jgi:hypothetical protein